MLKPILFCSMMFLVSCTSLAADNYKSLSLQSSKSMDAKTTELSWIEKFNLWFDGLFKTNKKPKKIPTPKKSIDVSSAEVDYVVVNKTERKMYIKQSNGKIIRTYDIALGKEPIGKKRFEGDLKTPEGLYRLGFKNSNSAFYKSIRISYPNLIDTSTAHAENKLPGGDIVIHGMPNKWDKKKLFKTRGKDWTEGCIALYNHDMEEFWSLIKKPGIFIKINP